MLRARDRAVQITSCRVVLQRLIAILNVQGGKKSLPVAVVDKFYIFDPDLEFQGQKIFFFFLDCILLVTKIKLFQETVGREKW